jgi:hypothetical protein
MATATEKTLSFREKATIKVLFFIVKMLNPTGYTHEVNQLQKDLEGVITSEAN